MSSIIIKIILVISSYLISLGVDIKTNYKILTLIADNGYTVKNGDRNLLWEEIDIPNFKISSIMRIFPLLNIISSCIECSFNLYYFDEILEYLIDKDIITPMSINEEKIYKESDNQLYSAIKITEDRGNELENAKTYIKEEQEVKKTVIDSNINYYEKIDKIRNLNTPSFIKLSLLRILKFSITNKIDNFNIDKLLESIFKGNKIFYPYYYELFNLSSNLNDESALELMYNINSIINNESIDYQGKEKLLRSIYVTIFIEIRGLSEMQAKQLNIKIDNEDVDDLTINISKTTPKKKVKK